MQRLAASESYEFTYGFDYSASGTPSLLVECFSTTGYTQTEMLLDTGAMFPTLNAEFAQDLNLDMEALPEADCYDFHDSRLRAVKQR